MRNFVSRIDVKSSGGIYLAILEKKVWVGLNPQLINHFESLGYELPKYIDKNGIVRVKRGTQILVKVEDLTDSSL